MLLHLKTLTHTSNYTNSTCSCCAGCSLQRFPFALPSDITLFAWKWCIFRQDPKSAEPQWFHLCSSQQETHPTLLLQPSTDALTACRLSFNPQHWQFLKKAIKQSSSSPHLTDTRCAGFGSAGSSSSHVFWGAFTKPMACSLGKRYSS